MSDWVKGFNEKHQRDYWKNKVTGETSWKDPTGGNASSKKSKSEEASVVSESKVSSELSDWVKGFNEKHQRDFWKNKTTGETTWKDPNKGTDKASNEASAMSETKAAGSDWVKGFNEKHQRDFWKNKTTGETTWKDPAKAGTTAKSGGDDASVVSAAKSVGAAGASDWVAGFNEKHQRKFWKNKATGETTWKDPTKGASASTAAAAPARVSTAPPAMKCVVHAVGAEGDTTVDAKNALLLKHVQERLLLQLSGSNSSTEIEFLRFSDKFRKSRYSPAVGLDACTLDESSVLSVQKFNLSKLQAISCNMVRLGNISIFYLFANILFVLRFLNSFRAKSA
jgi:hypothetical protein